MSADAWYEELTEEQKDVVRLLPRTSGEVATELGISQSAMRARCRRIDEVQRMSDGRYHVVGETDEGADVEPQQAAEMKPMEQPPIEANRVQQHAKQTLSREATEALRKLEVETDNLLSEARERHELAPKPDEPLGEVDVLIPRGDDHFGGIAEAMDYDRGETVEIFNMEIARERVRQCTLEVIRKITQLEGAYEFGTCHFALLGDSVTGETTFAHQPFEIEAATREQMKFAADVYFEQICALADLFKHLHIPSVPGNHGTIKADGASESLNADDFLYDKLEAMVRVSDLDNVSFTRSWRTKFVNFDIRDWRVHARHGQDSLEHIGTSSGKNRWRGWLDEHRFSLALRQHYHMKKREPVRGRPVLMSGSISDCDGFEESLSEWSPPGSMFYLIGDGKDPIEAAYDIHFE